MESIVFLRNKLPVHIVFLSKECEQFGSGILVSSLYSKESIGISAGIESWVVLRCTDTPSVVDALDGPDGIGVVVAVNPANTVCITDKCFEPCFLGLDRVVENGGRAIPLQSIFNMFGELHLVSLVAYAGTRVPTIGSKEILLDTGVVHIQRGVPLESSCLWLRLLPYAIDQSSFRNTAARKQQRTHSE